MYPTCLTNRQGPPAKRGKSNFEEYITEGNKAVFFKLCRTSEDLSNELVAFSPEMTHQVFGEKERIFGYKNLRIDVWYSASTLQIYFDIKYDAKVDVKRDGIKADDLNKIFTELVQLPPGLMTDKEEFTRVLEAEHEFKPFGDLMHSYEREPQRKFEIYRFSPAKSDDETISKFRKYHAKLQTFLLFFVDGASYIDDEDNRWVYYVIYEHWKNSDGNDCYSVVGYQTVYMYYAFHSTIQEYTRPRISQVLILPPYQRQQHCVEMLKSFYNECMSNELIGDITVEDPSENYQRVRDFVDCTRALESLSSYKPPHILTSWNSCFAEEAKMRLKMNKVRLL